MTERGDSLDMGTAGGARPLQRLLWVAAPYAGWMALALVLSVATIGSGIGLVGTSAWLISAAALHPSIAALEVAIVGVRFFSIARGVFRYLERLVSHSVTFRLLARLRVWFYDALEPLAPARLMTYKSGDLLSRAVADIETLQDFYLRVLSPPLVAVVVGAGMALWLWSFGRILGAALVGLWLLGGLALPLTIYALSRAPGRELPICRADVRVALVDGVQGLADIAAFGREPRAAQAVSEAGDRLASTQKRAANLTALQTGLGQLAANVALWVVLVLAMAQVDAGRLDPMNLAMLSLATLACFEAVLPLPGAAQALEGSVTAMRRLLSVVTAEPTVRADGARLDDGGFGGRAPRVDVSQLRFAYGPGLPLALDGVSFTLPPGKHLAIVGPSGAGKSTLAHLLLRFWDCPPGQITLEGEDIRRYFPDDVRRLMAVIAPSTYLFNATLRENLQLARRDAGDEDLMTALRQARLSQAEEWPQGLDTLVGERGTRLSGGEAQRLALARALLQAAPILILDEPTANLDPITEREVLSELLRRRSGQSVLLITHRLVGLDDMDEVLVLEKGRVMERGTEAELLSRGGRYAALWKLQHRALD